MIYFVKLLKMQLLELPVIQRLTRICAAGVAQSLQLGAGRCGFRFPKGTRDFFLLKNLQRRTQPPFQTVLGLFSWAQSGRVVNLTMHLHLGQRLEIIVVVFLLSVCAFMAGTGKSLPLSLHVFGNKKKVKFLFAGPSGRAV